MEKEVVAPQEVDLIPLRPLSRRPKKMPVKYDSTNPNQNLFAKKMKGIALAAKSLNIALDPWTKAWSMRKPFGMDWLAYKHALYKHA